MPIDLREHLQRIKLGKHRDQLNPRAVDEWSPPLALLAKGMPRSSSIPQVYRHRGEFDLIQQIAPHGRFIHF